MADLEIEYRTSKRIAFVPLSHGTDKAGHCKKNNKLCLIFFPIYHFEREESKVEQRRQTCKNLVAA